MFQQCSPLPENRDDVRDTHCPAASHETGEIRVAVGHLDGKGQITDVFEEAYKESNIIILKISFSDNQEGNIQSPDDRTRGNWDNLKKA